MQEWIYPTHWQTQQKGKDRSSPAVFWDLVDHMLSCLSREHYMRGQAKIRSLWMLTMKSRGDRSLVAPGARIVPVFPCKHMQTEADPFTLGPAAACMSAGRLSDSAGLSAAIWAILADGHGCLPDPLWRMLSSFTWSPTHRFTRASRCKNFICNESSSDDVKFYKRTTDVLSGENAVNH